MEATMPMVMKNTGKNCAHVTKLLKVTVQPSMYELIKRVSTSVLEICKCSSNDHKNLCSICPYFCRCCPSDTFQQNRDTHLTPIVYVVYGIKLDAFSTMNPTLAFLPTWP